MKLSDAVILITGANRGLGLAFAREALARGARTVYAAARDPASMSLPGVVAVQLDVTQEDQIAEAVVRCPDVTILVNNAAIGEVGGFLADDAIDSARRHLEVNFFGPLRLSRAFAPVLARHGGGAILNVLSVASWVNTPMLGVYGATKTAAWALTNGLRRELREQQTQVSALHMGFVDTDLIRDIDVPKQRPVDVVRAAFDGLEAGMMEILADQRARDIKAGLGADPAIYL